mgnify:CR=1 FL=1
MKKIYTTQLKKILHLKDKITNQALDYLKEELTTTVNKDEKIKYLEKKLEYFEEQIKTQNTLNSTFLKSIDMQEKEKERLNKDMQILVVALKDIYTLVESNLSGDDLIDILLKKNKKNDTYHWDLWIKA